METQKDRAFDDLLRHAVYPEERSDLRIAERFLNAAEETFARPVVTPAMGRRRDIDSGRLARLRRRSVRGFEKDLVFYRPAENGLEFLRVLHGARDLDRIPEEEAEEDDPR